VNKETLKYVLTQSAMRPLPAAMPRTLELPLDSNKIVALVGIRRSGKTFLLYETMRRLEARGVDQRQLIYLNAYSVTAPRTWAREIAALEQGATRFPKAKRLLVAHEHATRKPPAGIQVMDAWRYLLDPPLKA
jgi:predicted AAA+ superfamily ATPase